VPSMVISLRLANQFLEE